MAAAELTHTVTALPCLGFSTSSGLSAPSQRVKGPLKDSPFRKHPCPQWALCEPCFGMTKWRLGEHQGQCRGRGLLPPCSFKAPQVPALLPSVLQRGGVGATLLNSECPREPVPTPPSLAPLPGTPRNPGHPQTCLPGCSACPPLSHAHCTHGVRGQAASATVLQTQPGHRPASPAPSLTAHPNVFPGRRAGLGGRDWSLGRRVALPAWALGLLARGISAEA